MNVYEELNNNRRGSVWNRWEPHIHTPGTARNDGYGEADLAAFCSAVQSCDPPIRALGVTDYLSIDQYKSVRRMKGEGHLPGIGLIFPNVEFRLDVGTQRGSAVNAHLVFSPDDPNHIGEIERFLGTLSFNYLGERYGCTRTDLVRLGRKHNPTVQDDHAAYADGNNQFKVSLDQLQDALQENQWARANCLVGVAAAKGDGTAGINGFDSSFDALRQSIERACDFIFSGNSSDRAFWTGGRAATNEHLEERYAGLKPCLHGSDAHELGRVGKPDGDKFCWIKGDLTFESLRQACIEPEGRAYIGPHPPLGSAASNVVSRIKLSNAGWMTPDDIELNPGLVAIIGARGSGKTALADLIAAGGLAEGVHDNPKSFVQRAKVFLDNTEVALRWESGEENTQRLDEVSGTIHWEFPKLQYLSQQFVDDLCSTEGLSDSLVKEIERVVFNAHPVADREGATDFRDLYAIRCNHVLESRQRSETVLSDVAAAWLRDRSIADEKPKLVAQKEEIEKEIVKDTKDRDALVRAGDQARLKRHEQVNSALQSRQLLLDTLAAEVRARKALESDIADFRDRIAPEFISRLKETRGDARLNEQEWQALLPVLPDGVDDLLRTKINETNVAGRAIRGTAVVLSPDHKDVTPLIEENADLNTLTVSLLQTEVDRLGRLIGVDAENKRKFDDLNRKIDAAKKRVQTLDLRIKAAEEAKANISILIAKRNDAFRSVFSAIVGFEDELKSLYAPLENSLEGESGALGKLGFVVRRTVDLRRWVEAGEELLDLRMIGPFQGRGALYNAAKARLLDAWTTGTPDEVAATLESFIEDHREDLRKSKLESYPSQAWGVAMNKWLHSTEHIAVTYGLQYDGVDVQLLSPGTRGIVLLMLYLAIDKEDDRPLIIDQPEENLDPQSIFDELVGRFRAAKRRRQIIIVTHNANLVVNTDADQVIIATAGAHQQGQLPPITYESGGLENPHIRKKVCDILEGGEKAFKDRAKRLRVVLGSKN